MPRTRNYKLVEYDRLRAADKKREFDPQPGDLVQLINSGWAKTQEGDVFKVLRNNQHTTGKPTLHLDCSAYSPGMAFCRHNFKFAPPGAVETYPTNPNQCNQQETPKMGLYIALEITGMTMEQASDLVSSGDTYSDPLVNPAHVKDKALIMSDVSQQALKNVVNRLIAADPSRSFVILNSIVIAETAAAPVRYRQI